MHKLTISLPDYAFDHASVVARRENLDVSSYCSALLADQLAPVRSSSTSIRPTVQKPTGNETHSGKFDVATHFPGFPRGSIELAQGFVDEALKLPPPPGFAAVHASRAARGIAFDPNFVYIEYLVSRGGVVGIVASFYGPAHRHSNNGVVRKGRGSYSRAAIHNKAELAAAIPHIRKAYEFKFGRID